MTWIMGYKDVELDIERGTQNTVLGVSSKDDESKLRGKRAAKILVEEFGSFPRLVDMYNVLIPSVQEGDIVFGQIIFHHKDCQIAYHLGSRCHFDNVS